MAEGKRHFLAVFKENKLSLLPKQKYACLTLQYSQTQQWLHYSMFVSSATFHSSHRIKFNPQGNVSFIYKTSGSCVLYLSWKLVIKSASWAFYWICCSLWTIVTSYTGYTVFFPFQTCSVIVCPSRTRKFSASFGSF